MKNTKNKYLSIWCCSIILLVSIFFSQNVLAETVVYDSSKLYITRTDDSYDGTTNTANMGAGSNDSGFVVNVGAEYVEDTCGDTAGVTTITIKNKDSLKIESMKFVLSTGVTFVETQGAATYDSSTGVASLAADASITFKFTAASSLETGTITATDIVREDVTVNVTVNPADSTMGSIKCNGTDVAVQTVNSVSTNDTITLTATAKSGYAFMCWQDGDGKSLSTSATFASTFSQSITITPVFRVATSAAYSTGGCVYAFLDEAVEQAQGGDGKVVVITSGTLALKQSNTQYTIPSDVTVLVPYSANDEIWTPEDKTKAITSTSGKISTAYCTWTIPSGFQLTVEGTLIVNAVQGHSSTPYMGSIVGKYGLLKMASDTSKIIVASGGTLHARGLIQGSGEIEARSGATVYQFLEIADFRGGRYTSTVATHSKKKTFPLNQIYIQNIQVKTTYYVGCDLKCVAYIYMDSQSFPSEAQVIGSSTDAALFKFDADNTDDARVVFEYNSSRAQTKVSLFGKTTVGSIKITLGDNEVDSAGYETPLSGAFSVVVKSGSAVNVPCKFKFLPDCTFEIEENATVNIKSGGAIYLYDSLTSHYNYPDNASWAYRKWPSTSGSSKQGTTLETLQEAQLIIKGTLEVESGGLLYTSSDSSQTIGAHPSIVGSSTGSIVFRETRTNNAQLNEPFNAGWLNTLKTDPETKVGYFTPAVSSLAGFSPAGKFLAGTYYWSDGHWYQRPITVAFVDCHGNTISGGKIDIIGGSAGYIANGGSFNIVVPDGYVLKSASTSLGTLSANGAMYVISEFDADKNNAIVISVTLHKYAAVVTPPTCTNKGYTTYTCACGDTYIDNDVAATGHGYGDWTTVTAATCTATGTDRRDCANCDHYETRSVDALGHTEVIDAAVDATCTESGLTEGKHCSVCNEVLVAQQVVAALGHTEVIDAAVDATCTESGLTEGSHCSVCGEIFVAQTVVEAIGHSGTWGEANAEGIETQSCTICGEECGRRLASALTLEYRTNDYIWLNAIVVLPCGAENATLVDDYDGTLSLVPIGDGTYYLVRKMIAKELSMTLTVQLEVDGLQTAELNVSFSQVKDAIVAPNRDSFDTEEEFNTAQTKYENTIKLVETIEKYGVVAKEYFNGGTGKQNLSLDAELPIREKAMHEDGKTPVNAENIGTGSEYTLSIKGMNVLFEERLSLMVAIQLKKDGQVYDVTALGQENVAKIGLLVGDKDCGVLTVDNCRTTYVLYGSLDAADSDNLPNISDDKNNQFETVNSTVAWDKLVQNGRTVIYMDLQSAEYTSSFELRPFVVLKDGTVMYAAQYEYGLGAYIGTMLSKTDDALQQAINASVPEGTVRTASAFRDLLVRTWEYALAADECF